ncbi:MAG: hypothetical protein ACI8RZ_007431 [Myxococcota bacterium]|jgi:uncharacterized protein (TIGR03382 family)
MLTLTLISASLAGDLTTVGGEDLDHEETLDVILEGGDAIINGTSASEDDYPMTGGMLMRADIEIWGSTSAVSTLVCSSTLIAPDVVLLAAHCLDDYALTYGLGEVNNKELRWTRQADLTAWDGTGANPDWPADAIAVSDSVMHENFDLTAMEIGIAANDDIALLFLAEAVTDTDPAYLPTADEATQIEEGLEVAVVGWGQQVATDFLTQPEPGDYAVKMMGYSVLSELGDYELQVGADEADVRKCHGDSGGPTFLDIETDSSESMRLIGVTSHAYDESDCDSQGGVDTRVDAYLDWIDNEMVTRCQDGTRVWCDTEGILPAPTANAVSDDGEEEGGKRSGCSAIPLAPALAPMLLSLVMVFRRRR